MVSRETDNRMRELQSRNKDDLKRILSHELDEAYSPNITGSLRNDFMSACFEKIEPDQEPFEKVKSHENYAPSWSKKKQLATALRMLLTERVGHPEHDGITSLNKNVLAEIIVAIRDDGGTTLAQKNESSHSIDTPDRNPPVESDFQESFPAENFDSYDLYTWIVERRSTDDGEHAVYVLDCTPPLGKNEDFRVKSLRREAHQKSDSGQTLSKLEQAAEALNRGERLFYVGYASDVPNRIRQHVSGADSGGAKFTNMFSPQALVEVTWYQTESTARTQEPQRAEELTISGTSFGYAE